MSTTRGPPTACSAGSWPARSRPTSCTRPSTTVAFRDLNPQAPTHVLVVPREHYAERRRARRRRAGGRRRAGRARRPRSPRRRATTDYRLVFNTGAGAGQTVFHAHLHLLGGRAMTWPPG